MSFNGSSIVNHWPVRVLIESEFMKHKKLFESTMSAEIKNIFSENFVTESFSSTRFLQSMPLPSMNYNSLNGCRINARNGLCFSCFSTYIMLADF